MSIGLTIELVQRWRKASTMLLFALAFVGCSAQSPSDGAQSTTGSDNGFNDVGLTLAMCGTVTMWTAPDEAHDGSLGLDGRSWTVLRTASLTAANLLVKDNAVCIDATFDGSDRIDTCTVMLHFP
ncbi:MAG: hypothetical protein FWD73_16705 [Polyangiaceae bacterium]|nr:hypothetical protein [Polyangiaceae bacterium]